METYASLIDHAAPLLLVVFRIAGVMVHGPIISSPVIPGQVKVLLALALGLAVYAGGADRWAIDGLSAGRVTLWVLAPLLVLEFLVGMIVGFMASLPLLGVQTGGLIMGQQMGLGFATLYNPATDDEGDLLGQILFFMAIGGFLAIGGIEWMFEAMFNSFEHVPMGGLVVNTGLAGWVAGVVTASLELGLRVSMPVLAVIMMETVAMGFLAKTVPQLNLLSLGFPLRILVGIGIAAASLTMIQDVVMEETVGVLTQVEMWLEGGTG